MVQNCPKCQSENIKKVSWTWWGGFVGPMIIKTSKCDQCGHSFNSDTGGSNTTGIVIYTVVVLGIAFALSIALFTMM